MQQMQDQCDKASFLTSHLPKRSPRTSRLFPLSKVLLSNPRSDFRMIWKMKTPGLYTQTSWEAEKLLTRGQFRPLTWAAQFCSTSLKPKLSCPCQWSELTSGQELLSFFSARFEYISPAFSFSQIILKNELNMKGSTMVKGNIWITKFGLK